MMERKCKPFGFIDLEKQKYVDTNGA